VTSEALPHGLSGRDEARAYFAWMAELFGAALSGEVLDHGAGTGALTERLTKRASRVVALEPEPVLVEELRRRFATRPQVEVLAGTMASYLERHGARSLDAVVTSNVLEHLHDDVACLREMYQALRPGGALAVYVPARPELFGSLDASVGHLRRYTRTLLRERLEAAGFYVQWLRYVNLVSVLPWLVSGRLLRQRAISGSRLGLFDRYVFPLGARLQAALPLAYGLNVAALARRQ
jgi:SAM-dependent methyltransferase